LFNQSGIREFREHQPAGRIKDMLNWRNLFNRRKMKKSILFCLLSIFLLSVLPGYSQGTIDTLRVYRIETRDGNTYTGTVISENSNFVILKTEKLGELKIPVSDIESREELKGTQRGGDSYRLLNPQSSRYFLAPSGYGLAKGEAYYQNIWVLFNQFSYGFSNNFSVGLGLVPLFLFDGTATPVWLIPKISIPLKKQSFHLGAGAFLGTIIGEESDFFGLLFGTATLGNPHNNFSFGMAYGFVGDELVDIPVFNLNFMTRLSPRSYFISENHFVSAAGKTSFVFSLGGRSIFRRVGLDYSLWIPVASEMDTFFALPFLGVTVPLNRKSR